MKIQAQTHFQSNSFSLISTWFLWQPECVSKCPAPRFARKLKQKGWKINIGSGCFLQPQTSHKSTWSFSFPALEVRTDPLSQRPESKMLKVYIPVSMQHVDRNGTVEAEWVET